MLFTWSTKNLCIIFRGWRITGPFSLLFSLLAIVALTAGYEGVRRVTRRYEVGIEQRLRAYSSTATTGMLFFIMFYFILFGCLVYCLEW